MRSSSSFQRALRLAALVELLLLLSGLPPVAQAALSSHSARPDGDKKNPGRCLNDWGGTRPLWSRVDDDPEAPVARDYVRNPRNRSGACLLSLTDMPEDFDSAQGVLIDAYVRPSRFRDDSAALRARVWDPATNQPLTERRRVASQASAGRVTTRLSLLGTDHSKKRWNRAVLLLEWRYRVAGPDCPYPCGSRADNAQLRLLAVELAVKFKRRQPPQCSDGKDNDGDGRTDHPADGGCTGPSDNDEREPAPPACAGIDVTPGESIQAALDAHPPDTTFCIDEGIHRITSPITRLEDGDELVGNDDPATASRPTISGAKTIDTWTAAVTTRPLWYANGQTQESAPGTGISCRTLFDGTSAEGCNYNEWVYLGDRPLKREMDPGAQGEHIEPGEFYFDYQRDRIWIADDPANREVEGSVAPGIIESSASDVVIRDLVIEKAANRYQGLGALHVSGPRTTIQNVTSRLHHANALRFFGDDTRIVNSKLIDNGQAGVIGSGDRMLIEANEIAGNNWAGFDAGWEAVTKFLATTSPIVRNNYVHDNNGMGLWFDGINPDVSSLHVSNAVIENNRTVRNGAAGIMYELSRNARIRNNVSQDNGVIYNWGIRSAGIFIADSWGYDWSDAGSILISGNTLGGNNARGTNYGITQESINGRHEVGYVRIESNVANGDIIYGCEQGSPPTHCEGNL